MAKGVNPQNATKGEYPVFALTVALNNGVTLREGIGEGQNESALKPKGLESSTCSSCKSSTSSGGGETPPSLSGGGGEEGGDGGSLPEGVREYDGDSGDEGGVGGVGGGR